ncbi:maleylpyruvate isomerase family mycothiol-dependent enzyme [Kineosporia sp. J2-2]|uniref:Maleylpyruvate isomerase family mycothiol-dependent enzyme n=1 Tax=Kineosporia corallincola TaxID=2835133 RepID=A0ABS5TMG6_9ACTN|nr:maleylpyruvate isomerase family mycothiol-dependent enzyme [Kineosporia corallincola]MBT0772195.1 maleylpyruvate isomerase family mycothiol-dependent enzyme [Kineosporia corallincola]
MDTSQLRHHLNTEYARLRSVLPVDGDLAAIRVPSCPDWSLDDLVRHVGEVYFHKVDCIRLNARPTQEPDLSGLSSVQILERGFAAVSEVFDVRAPQDPAWTWFAPDQSVGFWIRRMAHETAIHRLDAELAVHDPSGIDAALAEDGLDEVLATMLVADIEPHEYEIGRPPVEVRTEHRSWFVHFEPEALRVSDRGEAATVIRGGAADLELWLYNRGSGDDLTFSGDLVGMGVLKDLMTEATQ